MSLKKVLVVEDEESLQAILAIYLEKENFQVFQAFSVSEADRIFNLHGAELDCILMDRKVRGGQYTDDLVRKIREKGFKKPIIAFSGDDDGQKSLMTAGCSHRLDGKGAVDDFWAIFSRIIRTGA